MIRLPNGAGEFEWRWRQRVPEHGGYHEYRGRWRHGNHYHDEATLYTREAEASGEPSFRSQWQVVARDNTHHHETGGD